MPTRSPSHPQVNEAFKRAVFAGDDEGYPERAHIVALDGLTDERLRTLIEQDILKGVPVIFVRPDGLEMLIERDPAAPGLIARLLHRHRVDIQIRSRGPEASEPQHVSVDPRNDKELRELVPALLA